MNMVDANSVVIKFKKTLKIRLLMNMVNANSINYKKIKILENKVIDEYDGSFIHF